MGQPSGQDVANAMAIEPLSNTKRGRSDLRLLPKAPLWFYVLAEADRHDRPTRLREIVADDRAGVS